MPPFPLRALALACLALCSACTSASERRAAIDAIALNWHHSLPAGSLEELREHVRILGESSPTDPESMLSVPILLRLVLESPSALARADALTAAWRLGAGYPIEPPQVDDLPREELLAAIDRLLELDEDPELAQGEEALELAARLARHRFGPAQISLAVTLGEMSASRALGAEGPVTQLFLAEAPASLRHALALVTERASHDRQALVRQAAYAAAPHLHPQLGLSLVAEGLLGEDDPTAHLEALDVFARLGDEMVLEDRLHLLDQLLPEERAAGAVMTDLAVRRRVAALRAEWTP